MCVRRCRKCEENKELTEYHKDGRDNSGFRRTCKQCCSERAREYRQSAAYKTRVKSEEYLRAKRAYQTTEEYREKRRLGYE